MKDVTIAAQGLLVWATDVHFLLACASFVLVVLKILEKVGLLGFLQSRFAAKDMRNKTCKESSDE